MVSTGLLDALAQGLVTGSIIAAGAIGLSLVYSIAEVPNFAHGDMITIGAYLALVVNRPGEIAFLPGLPGGAVSLLLAAGFALVVGSLFGGLYELAIFRRFRSKDADLITMVIISLGLALVLQNVVLFVAGSRNISYDTATVLDVNWDFYLTGAGLTIQRTQRQAGEIAVVGEWGYPWWLVVGALAAAVAVGYGTYRWRSTDASYRTQHLVSPRVLGVLGALATILAIGYVARFDPAGTDAVLSTRIGTSRKDVTVVVVVAIAMFLLNLVLKQTRLGKGMRATADNMDLAEVRGVDVDRVQLVVWVIAGLLTALAGVLAGWNASNLNPNMGFTLLLPVFAAVILGGIRSPYGAAAGALVIGVSMDVGVYLLPSGMATYRTAIAFVILILVLMVKPEGLWGDV
ncbi:branched-chain amino acid ABC transporter permease [Halorubellus sp. JP-L1]|uniref:branched-chain amino acid ABC transporter permease n=1 Tax=Halorubellus sp. JP-L1 TaxID=2715753 RepID=UPI00140E8643|nr:branched-chain amino acid ABC transporter permease [Halorubellus sp. JP-L1]NHN40249.1 branched-chain amino acid ABC transporter permease [Halorubellus sp. JP-L1]